MKDEEEALEAEINGDKGLWRPILTPVYWFKMLAHELHWTFVFAVVLVYGISQGLASGLNRVSTQYYMKDEQRLQPSESQIYLGLIQIPWMIKPLLGLLTDTVPVLGYRRKPYFVFAGNKITDSIAGLLGGASMAVLSLEKNMHLAFALVCLMGGNAGMAIADVTIDACITENSKSHPSLAADMQSLCGMSSSIGALLGFSLSGFLLHLVGPQGVFGLLVIPPGIVVLVGMMVKETRMHNYTSRRVGENFLQASKTMWTTLRCRDVWRPCIYLYLSFAFGLNIREGMFYWYTDAKEGPSFSQEVMGSIFSIGALGSLSGVILYQNLLKNHPFRGILLWTQLVYAFFGLLDLVLVLRINLKLGLSDYFFVVFDEGVSSLIGRVKWLPILVLSSKLCPSGIEGTFFALLTTIDHVGIMTSSWGGGLLLHVLNVTRTRFDNLWIAVLIRSFFRIIPVWLLFLIPKSDHNSSILPDEIVKAENSDESTEMAFLVNSS